MKKMFVLISHPLTKAQRKDAMNRWGVEKFIGMDTAWWSNIPADAEKVNEFLAETKRQLADEAKEGDILFVQGDYGATCLMVQYAYAQGLVPVYATTKREAAEKVVGDTVTTTRVFRHVRFRKYERIV